jgi:hypothetical protein
MGRRRAFAPEREEQVKHRLQRVETDSNAANPVQSEVLRLQRSGGNEAVAGVLARDEAVALDAGSGADTTKGTRTLQLSEIGVSKLLAFSVDQAKNEVTVTLSADDPNIAELQKRVTQGGPVIDNGVIDLGYSVLTLNSIYISLFRYGRDGTVMLTLSADSLDISRKPDDPPGKLD